MGFLNFLKKREKKTEIRYVTPTQMEDLLFFDNSYIPLNKPMDGEHGKWRRTNKK